MVSVKPMPVSEGVAVTVVVKWVVRQAVSAEVDVLEVGTGMSEVVGVANKSVKLSPTCRLNAGMSNRAGVFVRLGWGGGMRLGRGQAHGGRRNGRYASWKSQLARPS